MKPLQGLIPPLLPLILRISMFRPPGCTTSLTLAAYTFAHYYLLSYVCKQRHAHKSIQCSVGVQHTLSPHCSDNSDPGCWQMIEEKHQRLILVSCLVNKEGDEVNMTFLSSEGVFLEPKYTSGRVSEMVHGILKVLLLVYFIIGTTASSSSSNLYIPLSFYRRDQIIPHLTLRVILIRCPLN